MSFVIEKSLKEVLKKAAVIYLQMQRKEGTLEEDAAIKAILITTKEEDSLISKLYKLANINISSYIEEANYSNEEINDAYKKLLCSANSLASNYTEENYDGIKSIFKVGVFELISLLFIYYKDSVQRFLQISDDKYNLLIEFFKEKINIDIENRKYQTKGKEKANNKSRSISKIRKFGAIDLTNREYFYNPLVGNDMALRRIYKILLSNSSLIILGEAGVGKTTLVEGLAYNIKNGNTPDKLKNKQIISIPVGGIIAGARYVGEVERNVGEIIDYALVNPNAIFFIDEFHLIMGAGSGEKDNTDVSNLIKPYIASGIMQIIGATTKEEYEETIALNPAFKRRFRTINLKEPTEEEVIGICEHFIDIKMEETGVFWDLSSNFLTLLVRLTTSKNRKFNETITNPNLSLNIISDIFASALFYERNRVTKEDVLESINENEYLQTPIKEELIRTVARMNITGGNGNKGKILRLSNYNGLK